jgi:hypothetical protein
VCGDPADEFLHPVLDRRDFTLSETSYLAFNVGEQGINVEIFHWFHPVLRMMSGGLVVWQGIKPAVLTADYVDFRSFLPYPEDDPDDITYPTGVRVQVRQPLEAIDLSFRAPDGSVGFEVSCRAVMPAVAPGPGHFAQAMRCQGELLLGGRRHEIDGWTTRDRSWFSPRPEAAQAVPPAGWGAAVFSDDLAFHFVGADSEERSERTLKWGYVSTGDQVRAVVRMRKQTAREGLAPTTVEVELEDSAGGEHVLTGTRVSRHPFCFWQNMVAEIQLMRWEYRGQHGYGDYQDIQMSHFRAGAPA